MAKLTDKLVAAGSKPELSPNPDGSGFVKQIEANSLPVSNIQENVLYIVNGVQWKYVKETGWQRVLGEPNFKAEDGGRSTPVLENQAPKKRPQVFHEPVAFNGGVFVDGKKLEDYIDAKGGVTEEELDTKLEDYVKANPSGSATTDLAKLKVGPTIYGVPPKVTANPTLAGTEAALTGLQVGDTKYKAGGGTQLYKHTFANIQTTPFPRSFTVINTRAEPYTGSSYAGYLQTIGIINFEQAIAITDDKLYYNLVVENDVISFFSSLTLSSEQIADTVTPL